MSKVSAVYKTLYHYTNWYGLLGILDSQLLWATNFRFLNDSSELRLFNETKLPDILYPGMLRKIHAFLGSNPTQKAQFERAGYMPELVAREETLKVIRSLTGSLKEQVYIASFCGENENPEINKNGLLSQWRGYGQNGGLALVLDTALMEERLKQEGVGVACWGFLADVIYDHDIAKYEEELSDSIKEIENLVQKILERLLNGSHEELDGDPRHVLNCIARYKHRGFFEENEVRAVFWRLPENMAGEKSLKPVKYRNDGTVPYIELFKSEDARLPIERIIVGPHRDKEKRAAFLYTKLSEMGMDIEVTISDIPYVN